jgi:hypothetical protein
MLNIGDKCLMPVLERQAAPPRLYVMEFLGHPHGHPDLAILKSAQGGLRHVCPMSYLRPMPRAYAAPGPDDYAPWTVLAAIAFALYFIGIPLGVLGAML